MAWQGIFVQPKITLDVLSSQKDKVMRTLILDCNNIAYIQRFAFGDTLSHAEEQTGIMWGFFNAIMRLAKEFDTNRFIFVWDSKWLHRKNRFPDYKANRVKVLTDAEQDTQHKVHNQFELLEHELLPELGFQNVFSAPGYEADDLIAMFVLDYAWKEFPVVVSTDMDMYQLLDYCDVLRPLAGKRRELMTKETLMEQKGVTPAQFLDARILMGDSSDNISGLAGIGEKTALKYVKGELKMGKALTQISSGDSVSIRERNLMLMKLPFNDPPPCLWLQPEIGLSLDKFLALCDRYNFQSFLKTEALAEWRKRFKLT